MNEKKSNMLGDVVKYVAVSSTNNIGGNYIDQDNFYPMEGTEAEWADASGKFYNDLSSSSDFFDGNPMSIEYLEDNSNRNYQDEDLFDNDDDIVGNINDVSGDSFDFFDGGISDMDFNNEDFSYFKGKRKFRKPKLKKKQPRKLSAKRGDNQSKVEKALSYTPVGWIKKAVDNRFSPEGKARAQEKRNLRMQKKRAKVDEIKTRNKVAEAITQPDDTLQLIQQQAQQNTVTTNDKKGLSTPMVIGISLGTLALLGTGLYLYLRKK